MQFDEKDFPDIKELLIQGMVQDLAFFKSHFEAAEHAYEHSTDVDQYTTSRVSDVIQHIHEQKKDPHTNKNRRRSW